MTAYSKKIKERYLDFIRDNFDTLSQREIARRLNIGRTTVNNWSKKIGLMYKKNTVDENFFNDFSEKSTYILGFIFADGNVSWDPKKSYRSLTITASEKDKKHLEMIRNTLSSTKPLLYSSKTKSYRLIANSKKLCLKLMRLGVIPKKSLVVRFPKIPRGQIKHFIRGVIDGDGTIRYVKRERSPYFEITISSGSRKFCVGLYKTIKENIGIETHIKKIGKNTYVLRYTCSRGIKLAKFIYSDANIFLERKYLPFKENIIF